MQQSRKNYEINKSKKYTVKDKTINRKRLVKDVYVGTMRQII